MSFKTILRKVSALRAAGQQLPPGTHMLPSKTEAWARAQVFAESRACVKSITGGVHGYVVTHQRNVAEQARDIRVSSKYSNEYFFIG